MAHDAQVAGDDIWIGAVDQGNRSLWMSPIIIGIAAPIILGLVVAPQILDGAAQIVMILLAILLVLAIGAYILSVVAPGEPGSIVVRAASRTVSVVRHGVVANSAVDIAFADITRVGLIQSADPDGYHVSAIELRTRGGEAWSIPCEVDAAELAHIRRLIGLKSPAK